MKQSSDDVTQFHSVDHTTNPAFFAQFMDTSHAQPTAQSYKQAIMEQLAISIGATILDIGCGIGQDPHDLARAAGPHGRVIGIDNSQNMLQRACARAAPAAPPLLFPL